MARAIVGADGARSTVREGVLKIPYEGQTHPNKWVVIECDQDPLDVPLTNHVMSRELLDAQGAQGLFDADRKRALPLFARSIGIVTSPQAASVITDTRLPPNAEPLSLTCEDSGACRRRESPS